MSLPDWQDLTGVPPDERAVAIHAFSQAVEHERRQGRQLPQRVAMLTRAQLEDVVMAQVEYIAAAESQIVYRKEHAKAISNAWKQARFTMYGLALDLRQAEMMQRVIDRMEAAVNPPKDPP